MRIELEYGDGRLPIDVPTGTPVVRPGDLYQEPAPLEDPVEATRQALRDPLGTKPIHQLVDSGSKVVIGFPDRVKGGFHATSHRRVTINLVLNELERAGVKDENVTLVCGMHERDGEFSRGKSLREVRWTDLDGRLTPTRPCE